MSKSLEVLKECKRRDISTIPAMVVVTDGGANVPLRRDLQTGDLREFGHIDTAFNKSENEALKDVTSVCTMIRKENVYTVVINTLPISPTIQTTSGSFTTKMIASLTNGVHYELEENMLTEDDQSVAGFAEAMQQAMQHARKTVSDFQYLSARAYMTFESSRMSNR
jgi:Mg-chelatase subunit ChlD